MQRPTYQYIPEHIRPNRIIRIEEKYPIKIDWIRVSENPNRLIIISHKHDYAAMKKKMQPLAEELAMYVFHPLRMDRIAKRNNIPLDELITDIY